MKVNFENGILNSVKKQNKKKTV